MPLGLYLDSGVGVKVDRDRRMLKGISFPVTQHQWFLNSYMQSLKGLQIPFNLLTLPIF